MNTKSKVVVGVMGLIWREGKFLGTKRGNEGVPEADGKWQVPGGGMEYGEDTFMTLNRELMEEVGVKVEKILFPQPIVWTAQWPRTKQTIVLITYLVDIGEQEPYAANEETADLKWLRFDEVDKYDWLPSAREVFRQAKKILNLEQ